MTTPNNLTPLQHWMRLATAEQQAELAALAGTSREYLYQIAASRGYRRAGSDLAGRIARAAQTVAARALNGDVLPKLTRASISPVCRDCEFARACVGDMSIAELFRVEGITVPGRARSSAPDDEAGGGKAEARASEKKDN